MLSSLWRRLLPSPSAASPVEDPNAVSADLNSILDEFWALHWAHLKHPENVQIVLERYLRPAFGGRSAESLVRAELLKWHKAERQAPSQASKAIKYGRQAWSALLPDCPNPFAGIPLNRIRERGRTLTEDERERFALAILSMTVRVGRKAPKCTQVVADAIMFIRATGCRKNEALRLRQEQIDERAEVAYLEEHKTDDDGTKTLQLINCMDLVRRRLAECERLGTPWVFPSPKGGRAGHVINIDVAFREVCRRAGIVQSWDLVPHTLRRDVATRLINEGTDLRVVQRVLGHRNMATTARYAGANDAAARRAMGRAGVGALGGAS